MTIHVSDMLLPLMRLVGDCNRCGMCCQGDGWRCEHLAGTPGAPESTHCRVYDARVDGMPIILRHDDGTDKPGQCFKDSLPETTIILPHIGGPCSLTIQFTRPEGG